MDIHQREREKKQGAGGLKTGQQSPNLTVSWQQLRYKDQQRKMSQRKGDLEAKSQDK